MNNYVSFRVFKQLLEKSSSYSKGFQVKTARKFIVRLTDLSNLRRVNKRGNERI